MPFMIPIEPDTPETQGGEWRLTAEGVRPEDGAIVRRWQRGWVEKERQLLHTESRIEIVVGGAVTESELCVESPELRWCTQEQAAALYAAAGLGELEILRGFSRQPAIPSNPIFTVVGRKTAE